MGSGAPRRLGKQAEAWTTNGGGIPRLAGPARPFYCAPMQLTAEQQDRVRQWIADGLKLSDVQKRLETEFGLRPTYMEVRFLVDDLRVMPKDPDPQGS